MSLETDIAALTAVNNKLVDTVNGKMAGINAAVSAAVAAAPNMVRVYWVDSQLGNDADNIGSEASPFKTLQRAVDATPDGGRVQVWLSKDYVLDKHVNLQGRKLMVAGVTGAGRKLVCNEFIPEGDTFLRMGSFWLSNDSTIQFANMTLSLPASSAGDLSAYYALAFGSGSSAPIMMQARLYNCAFELRGTFRGKIFGPGSVIFALSIIGTPVPSALNGQLVPGIAAGTLSKDVGHVITNLSSL
ncbi:hypothetical protein [Pseudomonas putida]|uniref:hypothetical protein n=1 Tax=Pseudomonas putida TaxID=303 RepID=UPI001575E680|nr:hypothetical protein [Pseudomonas putida]NTY91981.1 hypothetical protein [Pseudomonas putida]NTY99569.1 hypothetical protein [Pseudomonas putida]NTZ22102.1 hypothetical protein [Pseudomonas putida]NTZ55657.1 hypothetical protein [Pseudomonas putida]NTZ65578.1 hypothetical protein [Pseudomonas putida]